MSDRLHEWPLVAFTALVVGGAGLLSVSALVGDRRAGSAALLALGLGFAVSTTHLGTPRRAPLALRRAGRSPLSNEIVSGGLTLAFGLAWIVTASIEAVDPTLAWSARLAAAVAAACLLVVIGLVYRLPAQPAWRGTAVAAPAVSGLAFGAVVVRFAGTAPPSWIGAVAVTVIGIDAALALARWRRLSTDDDGAWLPVHEAPFAQRHTLLTARLALFNAAPVLLGAASPDGLAAILPVVVMTAGLTLDRLAFYGLAVRQTTEAELRRAERAIERLSR